MHGSFNCLRQCSYCLIKTFNSLTISLAITSINCCSAHFGRYACYTMVVIDIVMLPLLLCPLLIPMHASPHCLLAAQVDRPWQTQQTKSPHKESWNLHVKSPIELFQWSNWKKEVWRKCFWTAITDLFIAWSGNDGKLNESKSTSTSKQCFSGHSYSLYIYGHRRH